MVTAKQYGLDDSTSIVGWDLNSANPFKAYE